LEEIGQTPTSPHYIGQAGEHLVCYLFHMWHYNILQPLNPKSSYDLVVERDGNFKTIQVKTTQNGRKVSLKKSMISYQGVRKFGVYKEGDYDYLCACKFPYVYVVPFSKIEATTGFSFSLYPQYKYDLNDPKTYEYRPTI